LSAALNLWNLVEGGISDNSEGCAIIEGAESYSYREFRNSIENLELKLPRSEEPLKIGILTTRSSLAYCAVMLSVKTGNTFVPLNPAFPISSLNSICELAGVDVVLSYEKQTPLIDQIENLKEAERITIKSFRELTHDVNGGLTSKKPHATTIAYQMFTSGTTGVPKGVPVSYTSLISYVHTLFKLYPVKNTDRCSQLFDLNFDLSIHDIFMTIVAGATLVPASDLDLLMPIEYVSKHSLTVWFSVPSMASVVRGTKNIDPEKFRSLRLSQFCGEPLTRTLANKWLELSPQSELVNLYGPTECTIAVSHRAWGEAEAETSELRTVPIGSVFEGHRWGVLSEKFTPAEALSGGQQATGELLINGPQVFSGYANKGVSEPFYIADDEAKYYRTGDLVAFDGKDLEHKGRIDDQVKIRGFRIELGDVEAKLKRYYANEEIIIVTDRALNPSGLVALITQELEKDFVAPLPENTGLPSYMIPKQVLFVPGFMRNASGKIDRRGMAQTFVTGYLLESDE